MSSLLLQFQSLVSDVIKNRTELGCPTPCNTHEYRLTKSSLGTNTNVYRGKMTLFPFYNLPKIKIEEEYTLMDAAAIITATGGSLSLFVGLSCYGFVWRTFEWLEGSYRSRVSSGGRRRPSSFGAEHPMKDGGDDVKMRKVGILSGITPLDG